MYQLAEQMLDETYDFDRPFPSTHSVRLGDSAELLRELNDESVHAVITSPPYGNLKEYPAREHQLGNIPSYEEFLDHLDAVWRECARVLVPGGRICAVVGDVC